MSAFAHFSTYIYEEVIEMAKQFCRQQFSGLELLSTPLLEEIIRADLEDKADYSEEMIQYVLEVIEKRKSEESLSEAPDVEQAWSRFQQLMEEAETEDCRESASFCPAPDSPRGFCAKPARRPAIPAGDPP